MMMMINVQHTQHTYSSTNAADFNNIAKLHNDHHRDQDSQQPHSNILLLIGSIWYIHPSILHKVSK